MNARSSQLEAARRARRPGGHPDPRGSVPPTEPLARNPQTQLNCPLGATPTRVHKAQPDNVVSSAMNDPGHLPYRSVSVGHS